MENKITKREMFEALVNYANGEHMAFEKEGEMVIVMLEDLKTFAENEIALLDKKSVKAKERAAAKKAEADELMDKVKAVLTGEYQTTADLVIAIDDEEATAGKVQARLKKLVDIGVVEKTDMKVDKRTIKGYRLIGEMAASIE